MTVRNQLTKNFRFAQGELEQTTNAIDPAAARARHAIKCVRYTAHPAVESASGILVPRIAMAAAHADSMPVKIFDCLKRSGQLRRDRHPSDHIRVLK